MNKIEVNKKKIDHKYEVGDLFTDENNEFYILSKIEDYKFESRIDFTGGNSYYHPIKFVPCYVTISLSSGEPFAEPVMSKEEAIGTLKFYGRHCLIKIDP